MVFNYSARTDGVQSRVIDAVKSIRNDPNDPTRRYLWIMDQLSVLPTTTIHRADAIYIVGFLKMLLSQESVGDNPRKTMLQFCCVDFSDEALDVLCQFLQCTTRLQAVGLYRLGTDHTRRLLESLHVNTSVKELCLGISTDVDDRALQTLGGAEGGQWIATLLRHKRDFTALHFFNDVRDATNWARALQGGLLFGQPHLQKLRFIIDGLGDEGVGMVVQSLVEGNYDSLQDLDFSGNQITPTGLASICGLSAAALPRLAKLKLGHNPRLLVDGVINDRFVQDMLLSKDSTIDELDISGCIFAATRMAKILRALENNDARLQGLDISSLIFSNRHRHPVRQQLIKSLPRMEGLRYLVCDTPLLDVVNDPKLMTAFRQNVSLFQVATSMRDIQSKNKNETEDPRVPEFLRAIMKRNQQLANVDSLCRARMTRLSTAPTAIIPQGLWSPVLAKVGQGTEGASPVFKVLQDRLASWNL